MNIGEGLRRLAALAVVLAALAAGCGGGEDSAGSSLSTVVYNSPDALAIGRNRLIVKAARPDGTEFGGPDDPATLRLQQGDKRLEMPTYWVPTSDDGFGGFYAASMTINDPGTWEAELVTEDGVAAPYSVEVGTISVVPAVGQSALPSVSKVLGAGTALADLTTDPDPDPRFYSQTVRDAVASGQPSVIVFATPRYCRTKSCGPVLDSMKALSTAWPKVGFVHVEIYEPVPPGTQQLTPVPAVVEWQLPSEPWVFVVDASGRVAAAFEGHATRDEVDAELKAL